MAWISWYESMSVCGLCPRVKYEKKETVSLCFSVLRCIKITQKYLQVSEQLSLAAYQILLSQQLTAHRPQLTENLSCYHTKLHIGVIFEFPD